MTKVTDPAILAQLNSSDTSSKVTDPNILAQLNGGQQQQATLPGMDYVPSGIKAALSGLATGGQNINQFLTNDVVKPAVGAFNQGLATKINSPAPINFDQMFGLNNPDMIDKLVKGTAQYSPAILAGGASLPTQIASSAAYNATQNPDHPIMGAAIGGALGAIPGAVGAASKFFNKFRPQNFAENLMSKLSGGQSLEENQQSLAQAIRNGYQNASSKASDIYNSVLKKPINSDSEKVLGDSSIYNRVNPLYGSSQIGNYEKLGQNVYDKFDDTVKGMHDNFMQNPTLSNAHFLQSQLGTEAATLKSAINKGGAGVDIKNSRNALLKAQTALKSDINNYLGNQGLDTLSTYLSGSNTYKNEVAPYLSKPSLARIATGDNTNPGNIYNVFKNPSNAVKKVASDLGDDGSRQILYSKIGRAQNNLTPESLINAFSSLNNNGLGSYVTPSLQQQFRNLSSKLANRDLIPFGKKIANSYSYSTSRDLLNRVGPSLRSGIGTAYPYINQELLANMLNSRGNQ